MVDRQGAPRWTQCGKKHGEARGGGGGCEGCGAGKARLSSEHAQEESLLPPCPQHWHLTQVMSLPVSHLVLLEL